jgi:ectoine hydroxylase-related dioxygenase (phytanoyl-CoA dioxygenase family)
LSIISQTEILSNGFTTIDGIYRDEEVMSILELVENVDTSNDTFRKSTDLFAIRQFLKEIPSTIDLIFNEKLKTIIKEILGKDYFLVKSIYFDKPASSNWYVPFHQDLTISVDQKLKLENFGPWTVKQNQYSVQPPIEILESIFTIRIHLDDTNQYNGALKVIPKSHLKKVFRPETIDWANETDITCNVKRGGAMFMKPLIMHSSNRTTNNKRRRVIHLEFSNAELPNGLQWAEKLDVF